MNWGVFICEKETNQRTEPREQSTRTTNQLLKLDLLEPLKLGRTRLHVQVPLGSIPLAILRRANKQRGHLRLEHLLEHLGSALVARVSCDGEQRFDVARAGDDALDGDEVAEVGSLDFTDGTGAGLGHGSEDEGAGHERGQIQSSGRAV